MWLKRGATEARRFENESEAIVRAKGVRTAVVLLAAGLAGLTLGCDSNPVSENRKDSAVLALNPNHVVIDAADTSRVNANTLNVYGSPTLGGLTFTACDSKIEVSLDPARVSIEPPDRVIVVGKTLGSSCVVATSGGLTDTATVFVVPAALGLTLTATVIGSGVASGSALTFLDKAGAAVSGFDESEVVFTVGTPTVADVDADGVLTGKAPGSTTLTASLAARWGTPRTASADFSVVPAPFGGTIVPAAANFGDTITITAPAGITFDADAFVEFDGLLPFLVSSSATQFVVVGPAGMGSSPSEVLILDVGPTQLAFVDTIDVPNPSPVDGNEPNNGGGGGGLTLSDLTATTPATLPFAEWISIGTGDLDDVFQITLAATTTINFSLDWNFVDADPDLLYYDAAGDLIFDFGCATAPGAIPREACSRTFAAGTYYIDVNLFGAAGHEWTTVLLQMAQ